MTTAILEPPTDIEAPAQTPAKTKPGPKPRKSSSNSSSDELVRYFLAKPGTGKPEVGEEFNTEAEAQIQAFRAQQPYYIITAFDVEADTKGDRPTLVPRARRA